MGRGKYRGSRETGAVRSNARRTFPLRRLSAQPAVGEGEGEGEGES